MTNSPVDARRRTIARNRSLLGAIPTKDVQAVAIVVAVAAVANGLYLLGIFNPNPINVVSGIGVITKRGLLPGTYTIDPNIGYTAQALGHLAALDWLHGHIPWWNAYEGVGSPLAGEMQSAALFPLTILLALSSGQLYFHIVLEVVGALSTYAVCRRLNLGRSISAGAGIAFGLNGTYSWFAHASVNPVAFLPLLILGVEQLLQSAEKNEYGGWITVSLAMALSIYAGFPETAYIDSLLAICWFVVRAVKMPRTCWGAIGKKVVAGIAVGALLAAPLLVAFLDYIKVGNVAGHSTGFANAVLPHAALSQLVAPYVYGPIFGFSGSDATGTLNIIWSNVGGYLTAALLTLALLGLPGKAFRGLRVMLLIWTFLAIGRSYGLSVAAHLVNSIPGISHVAFFRYAPPSWEFALIVLAGFGIHDLVEGQVKRWWIIVSVAGGLLLVFAASLEARTETVHLVAVASHRDWAWASIVWALFTVLAIAAACLVFRGNSLRWSLLTVLVIDSFAMFVVPQLSAPRHAHVDMRPIEFLAKNLGEYRFFTFGPISPNYGSYFSIGSAAVNDVPVPTKYWSFVSSRLDPNAIPDVFNGANQQSATGPTAQEEFWLNINNYRRIGVKYLVVSPGTSIPSGVVDRSEVRLAFSDATAEIYQLTGAHPYYWVSGAGCSIPSSTLNSVVVSCDSAARLGRQELWMAGWTATVNGHSASVVPNGIFQSVALGAGTQDVQFEFSPPHIGLALLAALLGMMILALAVVGRLWRPRPIHAKGAGVGRRIKMKRPQI